MNIIHHDTTVENVAARNIETQILDTLSGRIRYALTRKGVSKAQLAKMIGVKHQVIQYLCSHDIKNSRFLPLIAEALHLDIEWLTLGQGAFQSLAVQKPALYEIPLLDETGIQYLCANHDKTLRDQDIARYKKSTLFSTKKPNEEGSVFCFIMHDTAMSPAIPLESVVFIDRKKPLTHESYGLFFMPNKQSILRKVKYIEDQIILIAFNELIYKNIPLNETALYLGTVTEIRWFAA